MENPNAYRGLHFDVAPRRVPRRLVIVIVIAALFTILWWIVPQLALYWLLLPPIAILTWVASYGWREAISGLIRFLQSLEQL